MEQLLLYPMSFHLVWCCLLYLLLTLLRAPSVWGLYKNSQIVAVSKEIEPRVSANLSNQFEWPVFFHAACIITLNTSEFFSRALLILAWCFIFGRVIHSVVQIGMSNIRLRGMVFCINFLSVLLMWCVLLTNVA